MKRHRIISCIAALLLCAVAVNAQENKSMFKMEITNYQATDSVSTASELTLANSDEEIAAAFTKNVRNIESVRKLAPIIAFSFILNTDGSISNVELQRYSSYWDRVSTADYQKNITGSLVQEMTNMLKGLKWVVKEDFSSALLRDALHDAGMNNGKYKRERLIVWGYVQLSEDKNPSDLSAKLIVDTPAEFPGGTDKLSDYVKQNMKYPPHCAKYYIQGRVMVSLIVKEDGSIANIYVLKKTHPLLEREAMRIVSTMPRWSPAKDGDGKPMNMFFMLPVTFRL